MHASAGIVARDAQWAPNVLAVHDRFDQPCGARCGRDPRQVEHLAELGQGLLGIVTLAAIHASLVGTIEVAPRSHHASDERDLPDLCGVDDMGEHIVHGPVTAQRRRAPLCLGDSGQVVQQAASISVDQCPHLSPGKRHGQPP